MIIHGRNSPQGTCKICYFSPGQITNVFEYKISWNESAEQKVCNKISQVTGPYYISSIQIITSNTIYLYLIDTDPQGNKIDFIEGMLLQYGNMFTIAYLFVNISYYLLFFNVFHHTIALAL